MSEDINYNMDGSNKHSSIERGMDTSYLDSCRMFIGLGAQKSGTSWLSNYLSQHPDVFHSPVKEMNFFNTLSPNLLKGNGWVRREEILCSIVLKKAWSYPPNRKQYERIKDIVELASIVSSGRIDYYREYFMRRMSGQRVFGEFSPSYALLPPTVYAKMAGVTKDVRFIFMMRDPVERVVSNIRHVRGKHGKQDIDDFINELKPGKPIYERSNYSKTLKLIKQGAPQVPLLLLIYEELFTEDTVRKICDFLGISYVTPDFSKQVNVSEGEKVTSAQKDIIREKISPIYDNLKKHFGNNAPASWRW